MMKWKAALGGIAVAALVAGAYLAGRHSAPAPERAAVKQAGKAERKLLYYRNPMGLPDTSPVPKKDPMGMDYVPVYEGEAPEPEMPGTIKLSPEKIQKLGVRTEPATVRELNRSLRAVGTLEVAERSLRTVAPRFDGWVEKLFVAATGEHVAKGQPLAEVYSPELYSVQREYLLANTALKGLGDKASAARSGFSDLANSALDRMKNFGLGEEQINKLWRGEVKTTMVLVSPVAGVVTEKPAIVGKRFTAGEPLYQIADLSMLWLIANVFEQDIGQVRVGQGARFTIAAYPDEVFEGRVAFINPVLDPATRTVAVRIELPNPKGRLKPAMFGNVELAAGAPQRVLAVPNSAVIDSGTRQVVLVGSGEGRFEPREVRLGARGDDYVEVLEGVREGEAVVVAANFLIDAESNLKAALGSLAPPTPAKPAAVSHHAAGTLDAIDLKADTVTLSHEPIASLNWPAMTMDFALANSALAQKLKPGDRVDFEFVERAPGEYVITQITPKAGR